MKIMIKNMIFYGYHGLHEAERTLGQRFGVDITVETDHDIDHKVNHLEDTVDYTKIFQEVKEEVENYKYHLLEKLADKVLGRILNKFHLVNKCTISIRKIAVPINGTLDYVELEMFKERD
jgi:7,8-dihydroneopterin aldolase/epimerase/oxygenase